MRRQLSLLVAVTTAVVVLAFMLPLALLVRVSAEDRAVLAATQEAQNIALLVAVLTDKGQLASAVGLLNEQSGRETTVFLPDGTVVGVQTGVTAGVQKAQQGSALTDKVAGGREVLQPVSTSAGQAVVRTFVPNEQLDSGVTRAWLMLLASGVGLIAIALVAADRLAKGVTRPLAELATAAHALGEGKLDTRVHPVGPREVVELATVINRLAGRIRSSLVAERELVADLSHRLRTPITALRLDSEGLRDPVEAGRLGGDVDALEFAVNEVIHEARRFAREPASCDASDVMHDRVEFWGALAEDQRRPVETALVATPVMVGVAAAMLSAAIDGLLANVFAHTPEGTPFKVVLDERPGGGAVVLVEDAGPGFGSGSLERGSSGRGSTGLGLDIARRTAEESDGRLLLGHSVTGGASVRLELGPPAQSSPRAAADSLG